MNDSSACVERASTLVSNTRKAEPKKPTAPFHIPSLDGLRGAAFLVVFFGHALPIAFSRVVPPAFGVTVFFVLSGYLITTLLRKEFDRTGTVNLRDFYLRRALRILPPFYIVLFLSSVLTHVHAVDGRVTLAALTAYALHGANYWHIFRGLDDVPGGTSVYWSLAVEEHFYLLFPLLYLTMRKHSLSAKRQLAVVLGLCAAVLLWRFVLVTELNAPADRLYRSTDTRVDSILFGCALAIFGNPALDWSRWRKSTWLGVGLPLGALGLFLTVYIRDPLFRETLKGTLQAASLLPFFVVAVRCPTWGPMRLLNSRLLKFFGLLSYALYLSHRTILMLIERWVTSNLLLQIPIALGLAVAFCYALHLLVEVPCADLRKKLGKPRALPPKDRGPTRMPTPVHHHVAVG